MIRICSSPKQSRLEFQVAERPRATSVNEPGRFRFGVDLALLAHLDIPFAFDLARPRTKTSRVQRSEIKTDIS
jgi:hypothetical protein